MTTEVVFDHGAPSWGMQRNHQGTALLRACRQVPDWWTRGGRANPYAIKFVGLGTTTDFYSLTQDYEADGAWVFWIRPTATIAHGVAYGVLSAYGVGAGHDLLTIRLEGDTTNGNMLNLYLGSASLGKVLNIGTTWSCFHINFLAGVPTLFHNGVSQFTAGASVVSIVGNRFVIGHTETAVHGIPNVFANEFIIDEIAFFNTAQDPTTTYNSGVPKDYGDNYSGLVASYEVEKDTGSITASFIPPRYTNTSLSPQPTSFLWGSTTTTGVVEITDDALVSSDTNAFAEMCTAYGDYVRGTAVGGKTPLGTGVDLPDVACGLMPYPAGAGFSTLGYTGAYIGNKEEPKATPEASKATTAVVDSDSTAYAAVGGTASLGGVVDARAGRLFLPLFVKQ